MELIYLLFSCLVSASSIGVVSVKQNTIHFWAQRNQSMSCCGNITWQAVPVNKGRAFNTTTGVFTTPVPGYYSFNFLAMSNNTQLNNRVRLQRNGSTIATTWAQSMLDSMTISANLLLGKGDQISLFLSDGALYDTGSRFSYFTGSLLDQSQVTIDF